MRHRTIRHRILRGISAARIRSGASGALLTCLLAVGGAAPATAHGASAGDLPVVPEPVTLKHLKSADVVSLFGRETLPDSLRAIPRAARVDSADSLLPVGMEAIMRNGNTSTVVLVGAENRFLEMQECLEVLDVPAETVAPDRKRLRLTLRHADPRAVRSAVLRLPAHGTAVMEGHHLTLEGTPEWLHRALRQVIRAELGQLARPESGAL